VQVYCSPKLVEHAAKHARRNVVSDRCVVRAPLDRVTGGGTRLRGGPSRRPPTRFGAEPDLHTCPTPFNSINRSLEDASLSRSRSRTFSVANFADLGTVLIKQPPPMAAQLSGSWPSAPIRKLGHLRMYSSGKLLSLRLMLS
jgi:hypothetical protein